jgi:crossover junction endodeoxyribonuclease RusA
MSLNIGGEQMPSSAEHDVAGTEPTSFALKFDYRRPPLTSNDRPSWQKRQRLTRDMRLASRLLARRIPHFDAIEVSLTWVVADRRKRDGGENLAPTFKAMIDGLVDADVVDDDDQAHVRRGPSLIEYRPDEVPHMVLRITPIRPEPQEAKPLTPAEERRHKRAKEQIRRGHKPDARQRAAMHRTGSATLRVLFEKQGVL